MKFHSHHARGISTIALLATAFTRANAATIHVESGHADVAVAYRDGVLTMESRVGSPTNILPPAQVIHVVPAASRENRRASSAYDALGIAPGEAFYKLPQGSFEATLESAPFLGLAAEAIANGVFIDNVVRLSLVAVEGPGHFSLWRETAAGPGFESRPGLVGMPIASSDGIDESDYVLLPVGLHEHANWGFTAPGQYRVTFAAHGEFLQGSAASAQATFLFDVDLQAPPTDLNGDGATDRGDLAMFAMAFGTDGATSGADFTGDGRVGIADLMALRAALATTPNRAAAQSVCEPSAVLSVIVGGLAMALACRKKVTAALLQSICMFITTAT